MPNSNEELRERVPALHSPALRVLASLGVGLLLYYARAAFIPVAIALLLSLILATPVEALYRRGLPRSLSALLILLVFVGLAGETVNLLWTPAENWWAAAPQTLRTIERKVRPGVLLVNRMSMLTNRASEIASSPAAAGAAPSAPVAAAAPAVAPPPPTSLAAQVFDQTRTAIVSIVTVAILTLFLMAGGPPMFARMSAALASDLQSTHVLKLIDAARSEVSRYYASIAMINLGLGAATALVTALLGMPTPYLWGVVAAVLNFIPYAGSATTLLLLTVTAFVTFNTMGQVVAVAGGYLVLATIEGQIVQPLVVGRRLRLNPIIVFLALWFGGWFWGIAGIVMAVPGLVTLKVVAEHSRNGKALEEFLSPIDAKSFQPTRLRAALTRRRAPK